MSGAYIIYMAEQFCEIDELHLHVHYDLDITVPHMLLSPHDLNDNNSNSLRVGIGYLATDLESQSFFPILPS